MSSTPEVDLTRKKAYWATVSSLLALIALCVAWELFVAPIRPGGSWLVLKVLPLLLVVSSSKYPQ